MADRSELERQWRKRWQNAKFDLERARAQFLAVKNDPSSGLYGPDGGYAYQAAIAQETAALLEYLRVLRIYTDLVVRGKIPDEDDPPKSKGAAAE